MLHEEGLDTVVVALLDDPIGNRRGPLGDGEALAEPLSQGLQQGPRQAADGAVQTADRRLIQREQVWTRLGCNV